MCVNPWSPGGTYIVHKKPIFLSTPGLKGLSSGIVSSLCIHEEELFWHLTLGTDF